MLKESIFKEKIDKARKLLKNCSICPRNCGVNRLKGETGFCGIGNKAVVSSFGPHFGEEPPLVGLRGSGTIFMAGCNLKCVFCQNHDISHVTENDRLNTIEPVDLAGIMVQIQNKGCHNINFVTPTHVSPQIIESIYLARKMGLDIPIIYNCGGYESLETLKLLEGFVDIYMPDVKYSGKYWPKKLSFAEDYYDIMKIAVKEMHRQTGDLQIINCLATHGLLARHLVMPENVCGSKEIIDFLANDISQDTYVNVMEQYRPVFNASQFKEISRRITSDEFYDVYNYAREKGLRLAE